MKIRKLTLNSDKIQEELAFYSKVLECKILRSDSVSFTAKVGWSELTFRQTNRTNLYHYCFLIPSNKLSQALEWMNKRTQILNVTDDGLKVQNFKSWNADSFYFLDASGNIAEFIVRHNLNNICDSDFNSNCIEGVNEIGLPTTNIHTTNLQLEKALKTKFWKGDMHRFGTHGSEEGIFLLPNQEHKEVWFPTSIPIRPSPFQAVVEINGKRTTVIFVNNKLSFEENYPTST